MSLAEVKELTKTASLVPAGIGDCMLNPGDARVLYALGYASAGATLEMGSYAGCSTIQLALGMEARRIADKRSEDDGN